MYLDDLRDLAVHVSERVFEAVLTHLDSLNFDVQIVQSDALKLIDLTSD